MLEITKLLLRLFVLCLGKLLLFSICSLDFQTLGYNPNRWFIALKVYSNTLIARKTQFSFVLTVYDLRINLLSFIKRLNFLD